MSATAGSVLLRGMGDVSLEGQSVNFTATSGITVQSQVVTISFAKNV